MTGAVKIRGYRWAMTYRGFETYRYEGRAAGKAAWLMFPAAKVKAQYPTAPDFQGSNDVALMNKVDEFWTGLGL